MEGKKIKMKYTLVTIHPSRLVFHCVGGGSVVPVVVVAASLFLALKLKGLCLILQNFVIRRPLAQPNAGHVGTQANQYTEVSTPTEMGSKTVASKVAKKTSAMLCVPVLHWICEACPVIEMNDVIPINTTWTFSGHGTCEMCK